MKNFELITNKKKKVFYLKIKKLFIVNKMPIKIYNKHHFNNKKTSN